MTMPCTDTSKNPIRTSTIMDFFLGVLAHARAQCRRGNQLVYLRFFRSTRKTQLRKELDLSFSPVNILFIASSSDFPPVLLFSLQLRKEERKTFLSRHCDACFCRSPGARGSKSKTFFAKESTERQPCLVTCSPGVHPFISRRRSSIEGNVKSRSERKVKPNNELHNCTVVDLGFDIRNPWG